MTCPDRDATYVHTPSGARFRFIGYAARTGQVVLTRVDLPDDDFWVTSRVGFGRFFAKASDLEELADALDPDAPIPFTVAGQQPISEFTTEPDGCGPFWSDDRLALIIDGWARDLAGGAS